MKLLILDEPTAALNEAESAHLLDLILGLKGQGHQLDHDQPQAQRDRAVADEITIIRDGRTIETLDVKADGVDEDRIIRGMVGRTLESRFPERTPEHRREVLRGARTGSCSTRRSPDRLVVKNSSFFVRRGEIVGFAGLMGAGRTELAMSVFGRSYGNFVSGEIYKDGKEIQVRNVCEAIDNGMAYVSEDRKVLGLNLLDDIKQSIVSAKLKKISKCDVVNDDAEYAVAERVPQEPPHQDARMSTAA